eukprot:gene17257-23432_t
MFRRRLWASLGCLGVIAIASTPCRAQVLEIADDGGVTTYSGPTVHTNLGARPII